MMLSWSKVDSCSRHRTEGLSCLAWRACVHLRDQVLYGLESVP